MDISVIVPVYCGEKLLPALIKRLEETLPRLSTRYEVILVDDGSLDNSWNAIEELAAPYPFIVGLRLMRNYGQHNATLCGVRAARYEVCVSMDQDLQHPPESLPPLLAKLDEGYDVVYGAPLALPQGFLRNWITKTIKTTLAKLMGISSIRNISAFRVFRTELRQAFENFQSPNLTLDVLLSWGTNRFTSVLVDIAPADRSNYHFFALVKAAALILTGYSTAPLRWASWIGFLMTLFGAGVLIWVVWAYLGAGSLPGFPFLASIVAIFGGTQLLVLGIFGEYLAQIFNRSMDRPTYVVSRRVAAQMPGQSAPVRSSSRS